MPGVDIMILPKFVIFESWETLIGMVSLTLVDTCIHGSVSSVNLGDMYPWKCVCTDISSHTFIEVSALTLVDTSMEVCMH